VTSRWDDTAKVLTLNITQTQHTDSLTGLFTFPLSIECTSSSEVLDRTVLIDKRTQVVTLPLRESPLMIILDKGKNLLATFKRDVSKEEYLVWLDRATDIVDRITAAKELQRYNDDSAVFVALRNAALHDRFWAVRNQAALSLASAGDVRVKQTLFEIYRDSHSSVRSTAIGALQRFEAKEVADFVLRAARTDSSYLVLSSSIRVLAEVDSLRGFDLAAECVHRESYRDMIRRSALNALRHLKDPRAIPIALSFSALGNPPDIRGQAIRLLGELGKDSSTVRTRLFALINDGAGPIRRAAIESLADWGDEESRGAIARRKILEQDDSVLKSIERALDEGSDSVGGQ
jgi:HEAT repeat protein